MDFPNVLKNKIAVKGKTMHNLSCNHLTTLDFSMLRPVYYRNLIPGDKISINASCFTRLAPLQYPVLGDVKIETRAFWIPYRVIHPQWQDFISNKLQTYWASENVTPFVPVVTNWRFVELFLYGGEIPPTVLPDTFEDTMYVSFVSSSASYDYAVQLSSTVVKYIRLTTTGKNVLAIINALGYEINWDYRDVSTMNALPLFAFARLFMDWYVNPNYDWSAIDNIFKEGVSVVRNGLLNTIFNFVKNVNYRPDYFTASQTSQLANGTVINPSYSLDAGTNFDGEDLYVKSDSDRIVTTDDGGGEHFSPNNWAIDLIHKLSDFMKRNSIAGSRYVDQMLARFGARPSDSVAQRSSYLGSLVTSVQMSDVTQTAPDTMDEGQHMGSSVGVGNYTGKGIGYDNGNWRFEADEHGIIIVCACVRPRCQYYQGRDRHLFHIDPLDFFTPEFDCVNMQAIRRDEWKSDYNGPDYETYYNDNTAPYRPDGVFGFTPRYAEYKIAKDWLTGDFRNPRLRNTMRSFHLFREINGVQGLLSAGYGVGVMDASDRVNYERIFQTTGTDYDHFVCNFVYDVKLQSSIRSISESLLPEEGAKEIDMRPFGMYF